MVVVVWLEVLAATGEGPMADQSPVSGSRPGWTPLWGGGCSTLLDNRRASGPVVSSQLALPGTACCAARLRKGGTMADGGLGRGVQAEIGGRFRSLSLSSPFGRGAERLLMEVPGRYLGGCLRGLGG